MVSTAYAGYVVSSLSFEFFKKCHLVLHRSVHHDRPAARLALRVDAEKSWPKHGRNVRYRHQVLRRVLRDPTRDQRLVAAADEDLTYASDPADGEA
jgi:hypothetical protein